MSAIALLLMAAQPLPAADRIGLDIRCMVAAQQAQAMVEGAEKAALNLAAMFFFGRVDSAVADSDMERRLEAEAKAMTGQPLGPILQQCGTFMTERAKRLQAIGEAIEKKEQAAAID